ncbi:hypothetical protein BT63DRAFT_421911 [Microthyrium microscopicum]|uniref:Uncharacterized protein n=1 Tax=Microthyrium microscopicum TaxID=703497 RepID=A0A6A6UQS0_9PEZI|nr:hypothetical protein BT63DRAFT_421911 [Microthyrium microscopicum]
MPIETITPAVLFKTAAFLNAITIPGHLVFGLDTVHPGLNTMETKTRKGKVAKASAQACFNYINGALLTAALLNWQWARTAGPKTREEIIIFWTLVINGFIDGLTYFRAGEYGPLGFAWVAPGLSVAAKYLL